MLKHMQSLQCDKCVPMQYPFPHCSSNKGLTRWGSGRSGLFARGFSTLWGLFFPGFGLWVLCSGLLTLCSFRLWAPSHRLWIADFLPRLWAARSSYGLRLLGSLQGLLLAGTWGSSRELGCGLLAWGLGCGLFAMLCRIRLTPTGTLCSFRLRRRTLCAGGFRLWWRRVC